MAQYIIALTVDGQTQWSVGSWSSSEEATAWMDKHDEKFGSLVTDATNDAREDAGNAGEGNYWPDVDVVVQVQNTVADLDWDDDLNSEWDEVVRYIWESVPDAVGYWASVIKYPSDPDVPGSAPYYNIRERDSGQTLLLPPHAIADWLVRAGALYAKHAGAKDQRDALRALAARDAEADWDVVTVDLIVQLSWFKEIVYG